MPDFQDDKKPEEEVIGNPMLDRRKFGKLLAAGLGSGLALGLSGCGSAATSLAGKAGETGTPKRRSATSNTDFDVVVVGAGLSGLVAALELQKAGKDVLILEASHRIGGRMYKVPGLPHALDLGGQWVGCTQFAMQALVDELKIGHFDSYETGYSVRRWGARSAFNGDVSTMLKGQCGDLELFAGSKSCDQLQIELRPCKVGDEEKNQQAKWAKLLELSESIPRAKPWTAPFAKDLDARTFQEFLEDGALGPRAGAYAEWLSTMQARIGGSGGFEPNEVSLLHMAWTQKVGPQSETPEKWLLHGGAGQIPEMLLQRFKSGKGKIELLSPVEEIRLASWRYGRRRKYDVFCKNATWMTENVVIAIPPPARKRITFYPELPPAYQNFMDKSRMGSMSKVHLVYPEAFWREKCYSGSAAGDMRTCEFIADSSSPGGKPGVLTSFIAGRRNEELTGKKLDAIKTAVIEDFVAAFGQEFANPTDFFYHNWNEVEYINGAFTSYMPTHVWTTCGEGWREPVGNIFWAGTETSDRWPGYFDGAIRAGRRAACEVLGTSNCLDPDIEVHKPWLCT